MFCHFFQYLQTAVAHAEAHGVHIDVVRQSRSRCFAVVLRKLLHKWRRSAFVFEDWNKIRNILFILYIHIDFLLPSSSSKKVQVKNKQIFLSMKLLLYNIAHAFLYHLNLLGTLMATFSPLLWRMFLVRVLKRQTHTEYIIAEHPMCKL